MERRRGRVKDNGRQARAQGGLFPANACVDVWVGGCVGGCIVAGAVGAAVVPEHGLCDGGQASFSFL